jgi:NlpC/P60 family putative phage cell wall peptidase
MSVTRNQLTLKAREYLGTRFHHQGRLKGIGIDCIGLLVCVCRDLGLPHTDIPDYSRQPDGITFLKVFREHWEEIPISDAREGDALAFWIEHPNFTKHAALVSDVGIIHTYQSVDRVVEQTLAESWKKRISAAFRIPGVV